MNIVLTPPLQDGHELIAQFFSNIDNKYQQQIHTDEHHNQSKELMLEGARQCLTRKRVLVLAPSHLEPIKELSKLFEEVVIVGFNAQSFGPLKEDQKNIKIIPFDFNGNMCLSPERPARRTTGNSPLRLQEQ